MFYLHVTDFYPNNQSAIAQVKITFHKGQLRPECAWPDNEQGRLFFLDDTKLQ